jgi:cytochrome c
MILAGLCAAAWGAGPKRTPPDKPVAGASGAKTAPADDGERVFAQNCSRCHAAPEGFSSRISGTIVRHMRVRASLSEKDERALLRYLNP